MRSFHRRKRRAGPRGGVGPHRSSVHASGDLGTDLSSFDDEHHSDSGGGHPHAPHHSNYHHHSSSYHHHPHAPVDYLPTGRIDYGASSGRWAYQVQTPPASSERSATLWKVTADAMSGYKSDLLTKFDAAVGVRVMAMFCNAFVSVFVMIGYQQTTGDGDLVHSNRLDESTGVGRRMLEVLLMLMTFLLCGQLVEYYIYQRKYEGRSWHIIDSRWWVQRRWAYLAMEIAIVLIHPFPGCDNSTSRLAGCFMFLRMYMICRVIRNFSNSYRDRDQILRSRAFRMAGSVEFSWAFCFRIMFMGNPWVFVAVAVLYSIGTFSYTLYIFERVVPFTSSSEPWTLRMAVWNCIVTMTTVGYGDIVAYSQEGRIVAGVSALVGVVLASILIYVIINALSPSLLERHAHTIRKARWWSARLEYLSTQLIQLWVRFFLWKRGKGPHVDNFSARNALLKAKIRGTRRKIALLEIDTIKAVEELELAKIEQDGAGALAGVVSGDRGEHTRVIHGPAVDSSAALGMAFDKDRGDDRNGHRAEPRNVTFDDDQRESSAYKHHSSEGAVFARFDDILREQRVLRDTVQRLEDNQRRILDLLEQR